MPKIRADVKEDCDQSQKSSYFIKCPICGQKLTDVEHLHGTAILRSQCRRCRKYVKIELIGVG